MLILGRDISRRLTGAFYLGIFIKWKLTPQNEKYLTKIDEILK